MAVSALRGKRCELDEVLIGARKEVGCLLPTTPSITSLTTAAGGCCLFSNQPRPPLLLLRACFARSLGSLCDA